MRRDTLVDVLLRDPMTWTCPDPKCALMLRFAGDSGAYLYLVRLYHEQMGIHESPFEDDDEDDE